MKIHYYSKSELSEGLKCKKYFMINKCKALADYTSHDIRFNKMSLIKKTYFTLTVSIVNLAIKVLEE